MNDNVRPIKSQIPVSGNVDEILQDLDNIRAAIVSGEYRPEWGIFVFQHNDGGGSIRTHITGQVSNIAVVGGLEFGKSLFVNKVASED